jgi:hypothetical protein
VGYVARASLSLSLSILRPAPELKLNRERVDVSFALFSSAEPTGGWILNCTIFWITLLTFLPANVLWVLNSGGKVARGRGKSIRRGRGMTSSRALSKQFELNKISYATPLSSMLDRARACVRDTTVADVGERAGPARGRPGRRSRRAARAWRRAMARAETAAAAPSTLTATRQLLATEPRAPTTEVPPPSSSVRHTLALRAVPWGSLGSLTLTR